MQRVDLIQDLRFETATTKIKATPDGEFLIASGNGICLRLHPISISQSFLISFPDSGIYPPQVKVYELRELSLKFERHLDSEIIDFQVSLSLFHFISHLTPSLVYIFTRLLSV